MLKPYEVKDLPHSADVSELFIQYIIKRYSQGKAGLKFTELKTCSKTMSVNGNEFPYFIQVGFTLDIEIYLN